VQESKARIVRLVSGGALIGMENKNILLVKACLDVVEIDKSAEKQS
jgi:hypothetical protein